ncbi:MAG: signal peptidase II, partial [Elusimicrobia bacterium]|nr:signal peptidase II [Elusimicrobiota bacterium]
LIDRIFRGSVVDFIDVGYKEVYRWPSFNVADSCVCIGVFVFIFFGLRNKTKNEK